MGPLRTAAHRISRPTAALAILAGLAPAAYIHPALAHPRLQVTGASRFDASMSRIGRFPPSVAVSGSLLDDVDHAIGGATVLLRFVSPDGTSLQAWPCDGDGASPLLPQPDGAARLVTGPDGAFCARATPRAAGETRVSLDWPGTHALRGAQLALAMDVGRAAVTLSFDPEPRVVALGAGSYAWKGLATVASDDEGADDRASGLALHLADERGTALGDATTDGAGVAHFLVPEERLGAPGRGEMRLSFAGDARRARASIVVPCERRVEALVVAHDTTGPGGAARASETEDGAAVEVDITSSRGPVPSGNVAALIDGAVVGSAAVAAGRAWLPFRWPGSGEAASRVEVRYVPDAPWYVAGPPASLTLEIRHTLAWRRVAVVAAGALLLAWFLLSRAWKIATPRSRVAESPAAPRDTASIELIAPHGPLASRPESWEGRVVDAHDGTVVAGARVALERPSFTGTAVVAHTTAGDDGRFVLDASLAQPGDHIAAEGRLHGSVARPAPSRGVVEIALVSRRRAILRVFVEWAKRRGAPFDAKPEPTPAHAVRMAGDERATVIWARAVEEAAFGHLPVDARRETEVHDLGHDTKTR